MLSGYIEGMRLDLPLYALQRSAPGRWLLRAPNDDPCEPAVRIVAAIDEPGYTGVKMQRSDNMMRSFRAFDQRKPRPQTRAEVGDIVWPREQLLECARLLDHLAPDSHDPERYFLQKSALVHELRRLARWAKHAC